MIRFVLRKIQNKKWLTTCLLLGLIFLVAAVSCQPMFKAGSLNKMLLDSFHDAGVENNQYPAVIGRVGAYKTEKHETADSVMRGIAGYQSTWQKYLDDVTPIESQSVLKLEAQSCQGSYGGKGKYLAVSYMPEILDHAQILTGEDYAAYDGEEYACIMSESVMDACGYTVGETLRFPQLKNHKNENLELYIAGIFKERESTDLFWYTAPNTMEEEIFVSEDTFDAIVQDFSYEKINYTTNVLLDYTRINQKNVTDVQYYLEQFHKEDENFQDSFMNILQQYNTNEKSVNIMLWVLELPLLGLVLAFIYMVVIEVMQFM